MIFIYVFLILLFYLIFFGWIDEISSLENYFVKYIFRIKFNNIGLKLRYGYKENNLVLICGFNIIGL